MALTDIQAKIRALAGECDTIAAKAQMEDADLNRIEAITAERGQLERQLSAMGELAKVKEWTGKSAGMGVQLVGNSPAGTATVTEQIDRKGMKSVLVSDDGDSLIDAGQYAAIVSPEYRKAFKSYLRFGQNGVKGSELKVLQEAADISGGFLVPEDLQNRVIAREPTPTNLAGRVTTLNTSRDSLVMPRVVWTTDNLYTQGMRVTWTGEIPTSATIHRVTEPVFGQVRIPIFTAMMSLPLTNDFVEDSAVDIMSWCAGKFSETIDLLTDNMIVNGSGIGQPAGIIGNAAAIAADVHTTAAAALTWDGIVHLAYDLPEQYDLNSIFVMNKVSTALALASLVDGDGRPYWSMGNSGLVDQAIQRPLLGYPVLFNGFMPNVGAGAYPIIFGDLKGYYLVRRIGFSIQVLRELYAETNQVVLLGRVRFGGQLVEDWRLRLQVVSA